MLLKPLGLTFLTALGEPSGPLPPLLSIWLTLIAHRYADGRFEFLLLIFVVPRRVELLFRE